MASLCRDGVDFTLPFKVESAHLNYTVSGKESTTNNKTRAEIDNTSSGFLAVFSFLGLSRSFKSSHGMKFLNKTDTKMQRSSLKFEKWTGHGISAAVA